ncbi:meiotically up-regulated gene 190 protein [Microthyrium microscopicum]|uniref:Meiotically up-regulated gene 190 protein n=1 Tax=Microthyrium microscopicum TaxID=703497 RepID=A0A6A6UDI3_9PEZI|nr:meiotically up-regulated gene 190 protein [Microthyrium microscopicum]
MSENDKPLEADRKYAGPYTARHPIPTVKQFMQEKDRRRAASNANGSGTEPQEPITEDDAENKNTQDGAEDKSVENTGDGATDDGSDVDEVVQDTSEAVSSEKNPKEQRKAMKKRSDNRAERVVTDPVTHLPIRIHDFTSKDLKEETKDENFQQKEYARSSSDLAAHDNKPDSEMKDDAARGQVTHREMERLFPPPNFDRMQVQMSRVNVVGLAVVGFTATFVTTMLHSVLRPEKLRSHLESWGIMSADDHGHVASYLLFSLVYIGFAAFVAGLVWLIQSWNVNRIKHIWDSAVWDAERKKGHELALEPTPESTHWLNSLMASIWPLINPDLFISLSDTLEDVMQASLPHLVRMISVDDIGQGSEAFRILGIRWLPKGAARKSVTSDGKLSRKKTDLKDSDRTVPGQGSVQKPENSKKEEEEPKDKRQKDEQDDENIAEGMEAEEGDFINLEVAFAYKARLSAHGMRTRSRNPHLYLAFYLPGGIKLPIWVELRGLIGTMRCRLQLTPDPPFFQTCLLSLTGQPKVDLSCFPLIKKGLNIMNLPLISNFVQSSVDAALAEYVAPKSLTLDLKNMLMGDDFKKDTLARGIVKIHIKRAKDFKQGDAGLGPFKDGSSDGYVTIGWAKFGKPIWSSRVITADMSPVWEETAYLLVTPQEINVQEKLRVQLWDSDRFTADDDLGRIEVDLADIMQGDKTKAKMMDREDGFRSLKAGEKYPGTLEWSVGYYAKTELTDEQLANSDSDMHSIADVKRKVEEESKRKLREATKDEHDEIEQIKAQDFKEKQDELIISAPPSSEYPSGILSIVVHQIQGLELETLNKEEGDKEETAPDEKEEGGDLPSSYCNIILNHQKIYRTRTKPKNSRPFFNAGTERFIPSIQSAHVHIAVRDQRVHEDDALIGIIDLPLSEIFTKRSQVEGTWPLSGGIGFGYVRISMVFRSVELKAPKEALGWDYGTLDMDRSIRGNVAEDLKGCRIKLRTNLGACKFVNEDGTWKSKKDRPVRLAVKSRYSSCLVAEFYSSSSLSNSTLAFGILWLKQIPDDEETTMTMTVWKGDMKRAQANYMEECGEKVGTIELKLKFWSGLSGYHVKLAKRDSNVEDVMDVLDCAADDADTEDLKDDDDSSSDDDASSKALEEDGKRGVVTEFQDYKKHHKELHRKNRGLMQWKIPRTMKWAQRKVDHASDKISGVFNHHETGSAVETEV